MKKKCILSFIGLFFSLFLGYGQILTIIEKNGRKIDTVKTNSAQIIDINGNLEIAISKTNLINRIRSNHPDFGDQLDLQKRIDALEKALTNQETLLRRLQQQTLNATDKKAFYEELDAFYKSLSETGNEDIRAQANALFDEWRQKFGPRSSNPNSGLKKEVYILSNLNKDLNLVKGNLANANGKSYTVSMIAHVLGDKGKKNRVHIENFDTISESELITIPRWVTSLTPEQATKLQELQKRAEDYNKEAPKYFESFKAALLTKLPDLSCIGDLKTGIQNFINNANAGSTMKAALQDDAQSLVAEIDGLTSIVGLVTQNISNWTINTPFEIIAQAKTLAKSVDSIKINFSQFKTTAGTFANIKTQIDPVIGTFAACYQTVSDEISGLANAISILKNQRDRFNDNDAIGAEVVKFTLSDLPGTGYIKLKRSGARDNGDELEVVLVLRLPQKENAIDNAGPLAEKNETLESRPLVMQLIGLHSETAVGIIMGDSFNEKGFTPRTDKRFLYAPSAALLLKVGSRKSKLYNDFIDFGFGLAISTPDFNTDGTPEFGAGLMFTAFKNILSVGLNYNVTLDTPFWSFGINLPFNLPGIPINAPK